MKSLNKKFLIPGLLIGFSLFQGANAGYTHENYLTVTFKPEIKYNYIKVLNLMTSTKIEKKISDNVYKLNMLREGNLETVKQYVQLFSLIPEVIKVEPFQLKRPAEKLKAGQIIPGIILVRLKDNYKTKDILKLDQIYNTKSEMVSSTLNLFKVKLPVSLTVEDALRLFKGEKIVKYAEPDRVMTIQKNISSKVAPVSFPKTDNNIISMNSPTNQNELSLSFKPGSEELKVNLFNLVFDTNLVELKNSDNYIFKLSENINPDSALKALILCPYISKIKIFQGKNK